MRDKNREYQLRQRQTTSYKEFQSTYQQLYRSKEENKEKNRAYQREYQRGYSKTYWKRRLSEEPELRALKNLRDRLRRLIKNAGGKKNLTFYEFLGCNPTFLREYIESLFSDGMCWDNYGNGLGQWSIDHIIPCCSFDLTDIEQQKICFHYTNLRPMWAIENKRKNGRLVA